MIPAYDDLYLKENGLLFRIRVSFRYIFLSIYLILIHSLAVGDIRGDTLFRIHYNQSNMCIFFLLFQMEHIERNFIEAEFISMLIVKGR